MTSVYMSFLRKMTKGGYRRKENSWSYVLTNEDLLRIAKTVDLPTFVREQQRKYAQKIIRQENKSMTKQLMFNDDKASRTGPVTTLLSSVLRNEKCNVKQLLDIP